MCITIKMPVTPNYQVGGGGEYEGHKIINVISYTTISCIQKFGTSNMLSVASMTSTKFEL